MHCLASPLCYFTAAPSSTPSPPPSAPARASRPVDFWTRVDNGSTSKVAGDPARVASDVTTVSTRRDGEGVDGPVFAASKRRWASPNPADASLTALRSLASNSPVVTRDRARPHHVRRVALSRPAATPKGFVARCLCSAQSCRALLYGLAHGVAPMYMGGGWVEGVDLAALILLKNRFLKGEVVVAYHSIVKFF